MKKHYIMKIIITFKNMMIENSERKKNMLCHRNYDYYRECKKTSHHENHHCKNEHEKRTCISKSVVTL